jgi:hypothetical protein
MSYSRNRTYSTNKKTREVSKLTTVGYVVFIENGESTRRYSRQVIPVSSINGSAFFNGTTTSKITTSGSSDASLEFGTGSFTIEWWQKLATGASFAPRVFEQPRQLSVTPFEVAMVGNSTSRLFFMQIGTTTIIGNMTGSLNDTWNHFAIVRSEFDQLKVYRNGVQFGSTIIRSVNLTSTGSITIGNSASGTSANAFSGSITNFHWLKGVAKYTASFTPTGPLSPISGSSALLLLTTTSASLNIDSSGYNRTMINTNTSFVQDSPF